MTTTAATHRHGLPDPTPRSVALRCAGAAVAWWAASALGILVGWQLSGIVPCHGEGFACLGVFFLALAAGGLLGGLASGVVAARLGLRWWFLPVCLVALGVVAFALRGAAVPGLSFVVGLAVAPLVGAAVAYPGRHSPRRRVIAAAALAAAVVVVMATLLSSALQHGKQHTARVQSIENSGISVYAPTARPSLVISAASGRQGAISYFANEADRPTLNVQIQATSARATCLPSDGCTERADGVQVFPRPGGEVGRVRRVLPDAVITIDVASRAAARGPDWTADDLAAVAREMQRTDARWLVQHSRYDR